MESGEIGKLHVINGARAPMFVTKIKEKKTIVNCFHFNGPTEVFLVYLFKVISLRICGMRKSI